MTGSFQVKFWGWLPASDPSLLCLGKTTLNPLLLHPSSVGISLPFACFSYFFFGYAVPSAWASLHLFLYLMIKLLFPLQISDLMSPLLWMSPWLHQLYLFSLWPQNGFQHCVVSLRWCICIFISLCLRQWVRTASFSSLYSIPSTVSSTQESTQ